MPHFADCRSEIFDSFSFRNLNFIIKDQNVAIIWSLTAIIWSCLQQKLNQVTSPTFAILQFYLITLAAAIQLTYFDFQINLRAYATCNAFIAVKQVVPNPQSMR